MTKESFGVQVFYSPPWSTKFRDEITEVSCGSRVRTGGCSGSSSSSSEGSVDQHGSSWVSHDAVRVALGATALGFAGWLLGGPRSHELVWISVLETMHREGKIN